MKLQISKKTFTGIGGTLTTAVVVCVFLLNCQKTDISHKSLPTYFSYTTEELDSLRSLKSIKEMTMEDLYHWEEEAFELVARNKTSSGKAARVYAYLMTAQRDGASLSFNAHGKFVGSLGPLSKEVLCEFFPKDCSAVALSI